ncbi:MAG TPA: glycosyltransferase family 4 protein [Chloroflexota bacterium]|nr:glycosyltransferase family 4 protein [Chloroflexota bacterium]
MGANPGPALSQEVPIVLYADEWGGIGGTAGYVIMLARGLRRRGYRVAAICHDAEAVASMRDELRRAGVDVRAIEGGRDHSLRGRLQRFLRFVSLFREYKGCVLALMMGYFTRGGAVTLAGRLGGASAIVRADLTSPEPPITIRQKIGVRLKDRLVGRIVVGAIENREAYGRELGRRESKIDVVHTGIELERFQPGQGRDEVRRELHLDPGELVVGTLSRLSDHRKGVAYFLEMAAQVAPIFPRARFLVVGDGVLRPGYERRAAELGIAERVIFAGWRQDVPQVLAAMDVFVMPSLFEGGPTSVLEAMAMAKPVVASRVGMVPEVIEDGVSGLIVPPGDATALTQSVTALLADETLRRRLGQRAREAAVRGFSIDTMVQRYLEVFAAVRGR